MVLYDDADGDPGPDTGEIAACDIGADEYADTAPLLVTSSGCTKLEVRG